MSAKHDITKGVQATVSGSREQLLEALRQAAAPISEHKRLDVRVDADGDRATIAMWVQPPLRGNAPMNQSWLVEVALEENTGESGPLQTLVTTLSEYRVHQDKMFGFIPTSPQRLGGRREFLLLLDGLETELRALDPSGEVTRF